jgi:hypothetical protein
VGVAHFVDSFKTFFVYYQERAETLRLLGNPRQELGIFRGNGAGSVAAQGKVPIHGIVVSAGGGTQRAGIEPFLQVGKLLGELPEKEILLRYFVSLVQLPQCSKVPGVCFVKAIIHTHLRNLKECEKQTYMCTSKLEYFQ